MLTKRKSDGGRDSAERLALAILAWMATDDERLYPFLNATGVTPDTLRASAGDPGFLAGLLDHVMGDEATLMAAAEALAVPPERIAAAWRHLSPTEFDDGFSDSASRGEDF
ncbi:hypothetical protein PMNALOAF_4195 [Methylobacterium adhaesivum]|jgi:hypothetical protein|uniref:DUF3572 domain-containing protein n=1 Tax=Methylobacterium adhaesivum TaxID=333297 RepID=A0ABT8BEJ2_9HYPH|nr:DUF3572 domain-containing protein [Methylobacterium adhaesivum]MDN3589695.1 DUF3572 domain-containing protein [Methylobacterium adhaesivum]GJD32915.1 hypothetical protein PMNALOAF_4195 [Methylobacterium adhaesivum]